jgi:hypothetical protein
MKPKIYLLFFVFFIQTIGLAQVLDQFNPPNFAPTGYGYNSVNSVNSVAQSFKPGMTSRLSQISVKMGGGSSGDFNLRILEGEGTGGTVLNTTSFNVSIIGTTEVTIPLSSNPLVISGNAYTFEISTTSASGSVEVHSNPLGGFNGHYLNGNYYFNNAMDNNYDLWFRTYLLPPATHLHFDGTNDNVVIPDSSSLDFTTAYTVEAMVKLDRTVGYHQTVVSKFEDDSNNRSWMINFGEHGGGALAVVMTSVGTWTNPLSWNTTFVPTIGTWYHIAVVFDSSLPNNQVKLYVNGALYAQTTWNYTLTPTNANVYIGGYDGFTNGFNAGANSRFLKGNIDEVRMWNVARTATQIAGSKNCELQGTETGLVAYYKFNHGFDASTNTGVTTLTDATANANSGTLTNLALTGTTSNWLAGSPVTTGSVIPSAPTASAQAFCSSTSPTVANLVPASSSTIKWYNSASSGVALNTSTGLISGTYYVSAANSNGCESDRTSVSVTVNPLTTPTFTAIAPFCSGSTAPILPTTSINGITGTWSPTTVDNTTSATYTFTPDANQCASVTTLDITVNAPVIPTFTAIATVCSGSTAPTLPTTSTNGITGTWSPATVDNTASGTYTFTPDANQCASSTTMDITVQSCHTLPYQGFTYAGGYATTTLSNITTCQVSAVLETASQVYTGIWEDGYYNVFVNGTYIGFNFGSQTIDLSSYVPINSVYVESLYDSWGWTYAKLIITSVTTPAPTVADVHYCQNTGASPLTATLTGTGTSLKWYTSVNGENYSATAPVPNTSTVGTTSYWVSQADASGCESERAVINVIVVNPSAPTASAQTHSYTATVADLVATGDTGATFNWYLSSTGGTALASSTTLTTGTYYVSQTVFGCESTRTAVAVTTKITSSLTSVYCGSTISNLYVTLAATWVSYAQGYRFKVTNTATNAVQIVDRPVNNLALCNVPGVTLNTQYKIEVAVKRNGVWDNFYGAPCYVSTPNPQPTIGSQCGTTLTTMNDWILTTAVANVSVYRFRITNTTDNSVQIKDNPYNKVSFSQLANKAYATTYTIEVAVKNTNGTFLSYGTPCNVTTPNDPNMVLVTKIEDNLDDKNAIVDFNVVAFPNPFTNDFKINIESTSSMPVEVKVYDMLGKLLEIQTVNSSEISNIEIGSRYASGVYNVIVSQGENNKTLRMVKR